MPPRSWLPRRSWRLEHNQCHGPFNFFPPFLSSLVPDQPIFPDPARGLPVASASGWLSRGRLDGAVAAPPTAPRPIPENKNPPNKIDLPLRLFLWDNSSPQALRAGARAVTDA